jgi:AcrR family transcriptional regulator
MTSQPILSRAKCSETTRQALLSAARGRFLQESYENVGLREIAAAVGVDVALIGRYFGSKEDLFREVLGMSRKKDILPEDVGPDQIPEFLTALFLSHDDDENENVERLLIILRSASSPAASRIVREALRHDVLVPLSERLGGANPEARASTSMAVWMGMTIMRTVIAIDPICQRTPELEERLLALFTAALAESLPPTKPQA